MPAQRYSRQRELIFETVCASKCHPTAEMVYSALKPQYPNLSLGTVYRNLNLLTEQGRLVRMPLPVERYDGDLHPHSHFCCQSCGEVSDLELPYDGDADDALRAQGFQVERHATLFYGLCPHCVQPS